MKNIIILTFFMVFTIEKGFAGIDSGGGKLTRYSNNPWFLENTKTVFYCVTSSSDFGIDNSRLEELVNEGIEEWKSAFTSNLDFYYRKGELEPFSQIRVATQTFTNNCAKAKLTFQFGFLSEEQKKYFDNPRYYVGGAVRTSYDLQQLTSEGFIYIAPLEGELAPEEKNIDSRAWSVGNNAILRLVLMHELGHVFGVSHTDPKFSLAEQKLMDPEIPEFSISKFMVESLIAGKEDWVKRLIPLAMFKPRLQDSVVGCGDENLVPNWGNNRQMLGITDGSNCTKIVVHKDHSIEILDSIDSGETWALVGTLRSQISGVSNQGMAIRVNLSDEQKVFSKLPEYTTKYNAPLFGEVFTKSERWKGTYSTVSGDKKLGMEIEISDIDNVRSIVTNGSLEIYQDIIRN